MSKRSEGVVSCSGCRVSLALPGRWYCRACQRASDARSARERKLRCLELEVQVPALKERIEELEAQVAQLTPTPRLKEAQERILELEEYSRELERKLRAKVYREAEIARRLAAQREASGKG